MHYIVIKSMNTLRNRTQIPRKTKDIAEIYSPAKLVIPPEVEKVRCWGTLLGTTGNLGRDTVKTNILDCNKKELSICLLFKINANYYLRGEAIHSMKKKKIKKQLLWKPGFSYLFCSLKSFCRHCVYQRFLNSIHVTFSKIRTVTAFVSTLLIVDRRSSISWVKTGLLPSETSPYRFSLDSIRMQPTYTHKPNQPHIQFCFEKIYFI